MADLVLVYALLGDRAGAESEAKALTAATANDAVSGPSAAQVIAAARVQLGETDAVFASLRQLLQTPGEGSLTPVLLRLDPLWDPVRNDPRFQELAGSQP
jgi:hypothetical protein